MRALVVIPCFNEEGRLEPPEFLGAVTDDVGFVFVDDGSTDATRSILESLVERDPRLHLVALPRNRGKGESVRRGLLYAIDQGAEVVGYLDADLSTPMSELDGLLGDLDRYGVDAVVGSRIRMLGRTIERSWLRHAVGRVFATLAAAAARLPVYDTQCGAKVFRVNDRLRAALATEFGSRWAFDVELLARLRVNATAAGVDPRTILRERALVEWRAVSGSRVSLLAGARAFLSLVRIRLRYR